MPFLAPFIFTFYLSFHIKFLFWKLYLITVLLWWNNILHIHTQCYYTVKYDHRPPPLSHVCHTAATRRLSSHLHFSMRADLKQLRLNTCLWISVPKAHSLDMGYMNWFIDSKSTNNNTYINCVIINRNHETSRSFGKTTQKLFVFLLRLP